MNMNRDKIVESIAEEIKSLSEKDLPNYDTDVFSEGILDSLNVINLITFVENRFSIQIEAFDVNLNTFSCVNSIADFVESKIKKNG